MKTKEIQLGPKTLEIPKDWGAAELGELCAIKTGDKDVNEGNPEGEFPFFTCSKEMNYSDEYSFDTEAILIAGNGEVGHTRYFNGKFEAYQRTYVLKDFKKEPRFIFYFIKKNLIRELSSRKIGSTMPYIRKGDLEDFSVLLPPLSEQEKIAEVLSTVDQAIEKTDKIIEESKLAKKGLMQDLLTKGIGHSEFKKVELGPKEVEIPKNWEISQLENEAKIINGSTPRKSNSDYWGGDIVWITPTDITNNDGKYISDSEEKITEKGLNSCSTHLLKPGSILMTSRATIGEASINTVPACTNQGFKNIVCGENLNNEYFYYYIKIIKDYLNALGSGSTFPEINKGDTKKLEISLPPLPEQKEIAEILSAVDKKIKKEKEYKEELERLKKGLMQDLLTGKVRVKNI